MAVEREASEQRLVHFHQRLQAGDLREVFRLQEIAFAEDDGAEHSVLKLADVARPIEVQQHLHRRLRSAANVAALFGVEARNEALNERRVEALLIAQGYEAAGCTCPRSVVNEMCGSGVSGALTKDTKRASLSGSSSVAAHSST